MERKKNFRSRQFLLLIFRGTAKTAGRVPLTMGSDCATVPRAAPALAAPCPECAAVIFAATVALVSTMAHSQSAGESRIKNVSLLRKNLAIVCSIEKVVLA